MSDQPKILKASAENGGSRSQQRVVSWRHGITKVGVGKLAQIQVTFVGWITLGLGWVMRYCPTTKTFHMRWQRYDSGKEMELQLHIARLRLGILIARIAS